jgi:16S rRNA processing protein RimM
LSSDTQRIVVAELIRPRGNKGELLAVSQTDVPGRLENLKKAWITGRNGRDREIGIEASWQHKEFWVLKFAGIDSIGAADEFSGLDLWVPRTERGQLPDGQYFRTDLIGFSVIDGMGGNTLGTVAGWQQFGGPPLMEVNGNGREVLIPFVESICTNVDAEQRVILVDVPEGLLEL